MALASEIRICRDCRYLHSQNYRLCAHPTFLRIDLVTGNAEGHQWCTSMRMHGSPCGKEGELWEPKPLTFWEKVKIWIGSLLTPTTTTKT